MAETVIAFVPSRSLGFLDEHSRHHELETGVTYVVPYALSTEFATELERQEQGRCVKRSPDSSA